VAFHFLWRTVSIHSNYQVSAQQRHWNTCHVTSHGPSTFGLYTDKFTNSNCLQVLYSPRSARNGSTFLVWPQNTQTLTNANSLPRAMSKLFLPPPLVTCDTGSREPCFHTRIPCTALRRGPWQSPSHVHDVTTRSDFSWRMALARLRVGIC
jgi:hypothetical protein